MSQKSSRELRRLVLKLAASKEEDREWVLSALGEGERGRLLTLLSEADHAMTGPALESPGESPLRSNGSHSDGCAPSGVMSLLLAEPEDLAIRLRSVMEDADVKALCGDPRYHLWNTRVATASNANIRLTEETRRVLRAYLLETSPVRRVATEAGTASTERRRWSLRGKGKS